MRGVAGGGTSASGSLIWARWTKCCEVSRATCHRDAPAAANNPYKKVAKVKVEWGQQFTGPGQSNFVVEQSYGEDNKQLTLFQAARAGDVTKFSKCILDRADVNETTTRGQTILMLAAGSSGGGALEIIQLLLNAEAAIEARDNYGWSALHYACCNDNPEAANALVANGSALNAVTSKGETSLMLAALDGHGAVVDLLMRFHADVSKRDLEGKSALYHVAASGQTAVAKQLLQNKASINARCLHDGTPLMSAMEMGHVQMANLLIRKDADLNAVDCKGETMLFHCIRANNLPFMLELIKLRAHIEKVNTKGQNVMEIAAEHKFIQIHEHLAKALGLLHVNN